MLRFSCARAARAAVEPVPARPDATAAAAMQWRCGGGAVAAHREELPRLGAHLGELGLGGGELRVVVGAPLALVERALDLLQPALLRRDLIVLHRDLRLQRVVIRPCHALELRRLLLLVLLVLLLRLLLQTGRAGASEHSTATTARSQPRAVPSAQRADPWKNTALHPAAASPSRSPATPPDPTRRCSALCGAALLVRGVRAALTATGCAASTAAISVRWRRRRSQLAKSLTDALTESILAAHELLATQRSLARSGARQSRSRGVAHERPGW